MLVKATKLGLWKNSRVRAGTVFEVPDDTKLGKWMERVNPHPADQKPLLPKGGGKPDPKAGTQSVI